MKPENSNYAFGGALVDELARSGLRHVCICPGSRSSPLTISFAKQPGIRTWVHLDERSAAYFALGMARALGEPVAMVCTSGTAAANLLPAVVEANLSYIPLMVLTADRPPELLGWGANQTILQSGLYGGHVKWATDLPTPDPTPELLRYVRATVRRAYATAAAPAPGPVHMNVPFREPLAPVAVTDHVHGLDAENDTIYRADGSPFTRVLVEPSASGLEAGKRLAPGLKGVERGIIVCGPQSEGGFPDAVTRAARALGYPVLADPLSQVRCGRHSLEAVIDNYDLFLRDGGLVQRLGPEVILRFGAAPTSKPLGQFLERHRSARHILVKDRGWPDPSHLASEVIDCDPTRLCVGLASELGEVPRASAWLEEWQSVRSDTARAVEESLAGMDELFEGKVFAELGSLLPENAVLFAGNSMPVRDLDGFFPTLSRPLRFMANRGASGIDGVVSTALGASAVTNDPLVLVLGDLSMYHDMNGLYAAMRYGLKATVIVLNNDGGGIFSFLPQARFPDVFEEYFGTPHGLEFEAGARMYNLRYAKVGSWAAFRDAVSRGLTSSSTSIIEVPGDRARNLELHRKVWARATEAVGAAQKR